jgi:hypothetical protein
VTIDEFCEHAQHRFPDVDPSKLARSERRAIMLIFKKDFLPRVHVTGIEAIKAYVEWVHQHRELVRTVAQAIGRSQVNEYRIARYHTILAMRAEKLAEKVLADA